MTITDSTAPKVRCVTCDRQGRRICVCSVPVCDRFFAKKPSLSAGRGGFFWFNFRYDRNGTGFFFSEGAVDRLPPLCWCGDSGRQANI
ncbi:hypothetical protein [Sporomusa aerivorans]|uniref:hypothetical protein n=1 Tax=Sporomusa aerivorans TaxID=204936 RepID=UPI00352BCCE5